MKTKELIKNIIDESVKTKRKMLEIEQIEYIYNVAGKSRNVRTGIRKK